MNALQQFLQAASNEAAGAVSGPVDLIGMGLHKLGVPVPRNALMSSEWMKQNGLMQDVPQNAASLAGQTFGLLSPVVAAAKAPQIARGLLTMGENAAAPVARGKMGQMGAVAWQGSPHKFDKFDSSKIGTGEGAQAYGHGLYLAEAPTVAKEYQRRLSDVSVKVGNTSLDDLIAAGGDAAKAARRLKKDFTNTSIAQHPDDVINPEFWKQTENYYKSAGTPEADSVASLLNQYGNVSADVNGYLYKVEVPDEKIAKMLDWDKPLHRQSPSVRRAVRSVVEEQAGPGSYAPWLRANRPDFKGLSENMLENLTEPQIAELLRARGVPGVRYLDGGSRSAGAGSSNFVVFPGEENALRILERNGKPIR